MLSENQLERLQVDLRGYIFIISEGDPASAALSDTLMEVLEENFFICVLYLIPLAHKR